MNCADLLHKLGPMEAPAIASFMHMPIEAVYTELVAAEAAGRVRVRSVCIDGNPSHCEWWPIHPAFNPQAA